MKTILRLFICLVGLSLWAQSGKIQKDTIVYDTIQNGLLTIEIDQKLAKNIGDTIQKNCRKSQVKIEKAIEKINTVDNICARQPVIWGYKIQIYYSNNREKAYEVYNQAKQSHGGMKPEINFVSPDYRVFLGEYLDKETAQKDLALVRRTYPSALATKWRVYCRSAKGNH